MNKSFAAFSWGSSSYNVSVLNKTRIELPVKTKSGKTEIAFDFMEEFISAMQKIVIKNVVDYLDLRIRKTAEITGLQPSS